MSFQGSISSEWQRWLPLRNGFFSGLVLVIGLDAVLAGIFDWSDQAASQVNWIVCLAIVLSARSLALAPSVPLRRTDLVVGLAATLLMLWPQYDSSWLALTLVALYLLWSERREPNLRAGALIALAVTLPTLWARFVPLFFSAPLEMIDVRAVALVTGGASEGNRIYFQHGPGGVVIGWACTSFANAAYSLLLWAAVTRSVRPQPRPGEWRIFAAIFASVFIVNTIRLALMQQSLAMYELVHGTAGSIWIERLLILLTLGWTAFGLRRELAR